MGVRQQTDDAVLIIESLGLDDAGVVHRRGHQGIGGLGGHQHPAAIGDDQTAVFRQGVQGAGVDRHAEQAVARQIKGDAIAGGQNDGSQRCGNHTTIGHMATEQRDESAISADRALVHHRRRAGPGEVIIAGHEIGIGYAERRGHEAIHIDLCARGEQHAVGIDQKDVSVGGKGSKYL